MFLNLPILSLEDHLGVTDFASIPFSHGLRHPVSAQQVTAASALIPPQRETRHVLAPFSNSIPNICLLGVSETRRTVADVSSLLLIGAGTSEVLLQKIRASDLSLI